jgi:hypothetical protein
MSEAYHDLLLHAKLIARDSERNGSPLDTDESTCQALEGTPEASRSS